MSLAAPSLNLKATGDPQIDRYPFSVKPDQPIGVGRLMEIMRDGYLMYRYLVGHPEISAPDLPAIGAPMIPGRRQ